MPVLSTIASPAAAVSNIAPPPYCFLGFKRDEEVAQRSAEFYTSPTLAPTWVNAAGVTAEAPDSPVESGFYNGQPIGTCLYEAGGSRIDPNTNTTRLLRYFADQEDGTFDVQIDYVLDTESYIDPTLMLVEDGRRGGDVTAQSFNGFQFAAAWGWRPESEIPFATYPLPAGSVPVGGGWFTIPLSGGNTVASVQNAYVFAAEFLMVPPATP